MHSVHIREYADQVKYRSFEYFNRGQAENGIFQGLKRTVMQII